MNELKRPSLREAARRGATVNKRAKQPPPAKPASPPVVAAPEPAKPAGAATPPETTPAKQTRREKPRPRLGRLPHRSTFHVVYDAEAVKWSGTLTVPQGGIYNASVTTGEDSAVFALLMQLDRAYRKLPAEGAAPEPPVATSVRPLP